MKNFISSLSLSVYPRITKSIDRATRFNLDNRNREKIVMYVNAANFGLSAAYMAITAYRKDKVSSNAKKFVLCQGLTEAFVNALFAIIIGLGLKKGLNSLFFKGKILPEVLTIKNMDQVTNIKNFIEEFQNFTKSSGFSENKILAALVDDKDQIEKLKLPESDIKKIKEELNAYLGLNELPTGLEDTLSNYHSGINLVCSSIIGSIIAFNLFATVIMNKITHLWLKSDNKTSLIWNEQTNTRKIANKPMHFLSQSQNNEIKNTFRKFINNSFSI